MRRRPTCLGRIFKQDVIKKRQGSPDGAPSAMSKNNLVIVDSRYDIRYIQHMRRPLVSFLLLLFALALATPEHAWALLINSFQGAYGAPNTAGLLLTQAIPAYPLKAGQWTATVAPAYFTYKDEGTTNVTHRYDGTTFVNSNIADHRDIAGGGAAVGATYAVSPHLGFGITGAFFNGTGTSGLAMECPNTDCSGSGTYKYGDSEAHGAVAAGFLIFDPFKDPEGFRLPIMVGGGKFDLEDSGSISDASNKVSASRVFRGFKEAAGLSAQFNLTRRFRFAPFLFYLPKTHPKDTCSATGGGTCRAGITPEPKDVSAAGVQVTFKPWNLGFLYANPDFGSGTGGAKYSVYALRWQRSFGGD